MSEMLQGSNESRKKSLNALPSCHHTEICLKLSVHLNFPSSSSPPQHLYQREKFREKRSPTRHDHHYFVSASSMTSI